MADEFRDLIQSSSQQQAQAAVARVGDIVNDVFPWVVGLVLVSALAMALGAWKSRTWVKGIFSLLGEKRDGCS